jgi:hypothetical protein
MTARHPYTSCHLEPTARGRSRTLAVAIANAGVAGESGTIRIGDADQTAAYIAGIHGTTPAGTTEPVVIDASGQLETAPELSDSVSSLATKVQGLTKKLKRQQRQINRLRRQVKGG